MYERSAIVLERYLDKLFGLNKENNLRQNFLDFNNLVKELKEYQTMVTEEEKVINKFDGIAHEIQSIQKSQEKLCLSNQKLEDERNKLFNALDENPNVVQSRLEKIEKIVEENNEELKKLREEYIKALVIFIERQKERNKFARGKRVTEANHIASMKNAQERFKNISIQDVQNMKRFLLNDRQKIKKAIIDIMIKNGKNEKIGFNEDVINKAVDVRMKVAEKEAECYVMIYEKFKKIFSELETDNFKLDRYEKIVRDTHVKIAFLDAEKEYIIEFLDNERMTVIGGPQVHKKMMTEACENFEKDIQQIDNLYELILREIAGKATKKAYKELYNKTYLRDIQQKEKNFEAEVNNIKINLGTVINSNYWRIEGIKNVYDVFQKEITERFDKDLSEYKVEEIDILVDIQDAIMQNTKEDVILDSSTKTNNYEYNKKQETDKQPKNKYNNKYEEKYFNSYIDEEEQDNGYGEGYENYSKYNNFDDEYNTYDENVDEYENKFDDEYSDEYENKFDDEYSDEYENKFDDEYSEYDYNGKNNYDDEDGYNDEDNYNDEDDYNDDDYDDEDDYDDYNDADDYDDYDDEADYDEDEEDYDIEDNFDDENNHDKGNIFNKKKENYNKRKRT